MGRRSMIVLVAVAVGLVAWAGESRAQSTPGFQECVQCFVGISDVWCSTDYICYNDQFECQTNCPSMACETSTSYDCSNLLTTTTTSSTTTTSTTTTTTTTTSTAEPTLGPDDTVNANASSSDGGTLAEARLCRSKVTISDTYSVPLLAVLAVIGLATVVTAISSCVIAGSCARSGDVLGFGLAVGDIASDCFFVFTLSGAVQFWGLLFVALPLLVNAVLVGAFLWTNLGDKPFHKHVRAHVGVTAGICLAAVINLNALNLLHAGLFGGNAFKAPIDQGSSRTLRFGGLTNTILEDIPQLAILIAVASVCRLNPVVITSVVITVIAIVFAVVKRVVYCLLSASERRLVPSVTLTSDDYALMDGSADGAADGGDGGNGLLQVTPADDGGAVGGGALSRAASAPHRIAP